MTSELRETADLLMKMADEIDGWADQSLAGGWSTHQVKPNRVAASKLREQAAKLYRAQAA
jgi:hypothetical protein